MKIKAILLFFASVALSALVSSCGKENNAAEPDKPDKPEPEICQRKGSGKDIYIPMEFRKDNAFKNPNNNYCYKRSYETDNIIIMWEKAFGDDPSKAPAKGRTSMTFDVKKLADSAESFYKTYRNDLKFIQSGSGADRYKMMIMVRYTTEGTVYGGSYDDVIGALWLEPGRLLEERLNTAAHELGHSFQFQLAIDSGSGFGSGGIFEMTSQWMLWQTNVRWFDDENYHWNTYMKQTHLAFMHPKNRYETANMLEYWAYLHGQDFIADLWRAARKSNDVVSVYKTLTKIDQDKFNEENYQQAAKQICYDMPRIKAACAKYANKHSSTLAEADSEGWQSISSDRIPQQYGYNGIELDTPQQCKKVSIDFRGEGTAKNAGWRFGFVWVKADGSIVYSDMYKADKSGDIVSATIDLDDSYTHLWLVVTAAPSVHTYLSEENTDNYAQYPYSVRIRYQ